MMNKAWGKIKPWFTIGKDSLAIWLSAIVLGATVAFTRGNGIHGIIDFGAFTLLGLFSTVLILAAAYPISKTLIERISQTGYIDDQAKFIIIICVTIIAFSLGILLVHYWQPTEDLDLYD